MMIATLKSDPQHTRSREQEVKLLDAVTAAVNCMCPHCVGAAKCHYGGHHCMVQKLVDLVKGDGWMNRYVGHWVRSGEFSALHPMSNGRLIECKPTPIRKRIKSK